MAWEDYLEPEVGVAVAITAAVASPRVRTVLRRGAVYGLAGILMAGDAVSALAQGVKRGVQQATTNVPTVTEAEAAVAPEVLQADGGETAPLESAPSPATPAEATAGESHATPPRQARKAAEAAGDE